jgi:copper(I)-binding protein
MKANLLPALALVLGASFTAATASASPSIQITAAWIQSPMPGARDTAGYVRIANGADSDDRLLSVSSRWAGRVDMHEMVTEDGMMGMRPLIYGVKVPAGGTIDFSPQALHLMLVNPRKPFVAGRSKVPLQFHFQKAGTIAVEVPVQNIAPASSEAPQPEHHH